MKITQVTPGEPWTGNNGTVYTATLELEDGRKGSVNMMKPDRWSIGDEIEITHEEHTNHGIKWKVSKMGMSNRSYGSPAPSQPPSNLQNEINASWALNQVLLHGDFTVKDFDDKGEEIILASRKLLSIRKELRKRMDAQ